MSTIEKALKLLENFSGMNPEIGLSEFKAMTGLDKGTLHRHLTSLRDFGFLEQNPNTKAYRLGPAIIRLAAVREKTVPMTTIVRSYVDEMAEHVHELVHAALPQKNGMSAIYAKDRGDHGTRVGFDEAEILPFHATSSGMAMLAFAEPDFVDTVLSSNLKQFTHTTATDIKDIKEKLQVVRQQGFSFSDQSYEAEVTSVAVPFFGLEGHVMGTLAIAAPASRMNDTLRDTSLTELIAASTSISRDLGGFIPSNLAACWATRLET